MIALYARQSVEKDGSISIETQMGYCEAMLRPDERKETIRRFIDNGFSGGNTDRDGFRDMMKLVEQGEISKIVVYRLDRISRSLTDFVGILEVLKRHRVAFVSSQESFDTSSPYGEMLTKLLMVFAEYERRTIIERITQAYAHRAEQGIYMGGRRPYGFNLVDTVICGVKTKMLSPEPKEAEIVKTIYGSYAVQGVTLRRVLDRLTQEHSVSCEGAWSTAKLSVMIKNPIYVKADHAIYEFFTERNTKIVSDASDFDGTRGVQLYGRTRHETEDWSDLKAIVMRHEGLIPSDVWLACQKKLHGNRQIGNALSNSTSWLGGKLVCGSCRRTMTVTKGSKRADGSQTRYFSCTGRSRHRICKGIGVTVYADSMEDLVYGLISEKLPSLKAFRRAGSVEHRAKINAWKNRLSEIGDAQEKLVTQMLWHDVGSDMLALLNEKAKRLSDERRSLLEKIKALEESETEVVNASALSKRWKQADFEEKRAVCNLLIHKIYVSENGATEIVWNI